MNRNESQWSLGAEKVTVTYGQKVRAVSDVSLTVSRGELVGLIGPNGAGKTSFIDALTGYASSASGVVKLAGRSLAHLSPHRRAHAGLVRTFQNLEIFGDLTVAENMKVAHSASRRGSRRSLEQGMSLIPRHDPTCPASVLAQGDRRLLALARAVACNPEILILDEPAAGLDTNESRQLGVNLLQLVEDGLGVLLVDHDMSLVLGACHRVAVLDFGKLIAEGSPAEIRTDERVRRAYLGV
jgi:ABC-type branched-subunit amino acid transport system ATPase component